MIKLKKPANGIPLGKDHIFNLQAIWEDDTYPNLASAKFWLTIKEKLTDTMEEAAVAINSDDDAAQFVITGAATGQYQVWLKAADTEDLDPDKWYHIDTQIDLGDGLLHTHLYDKIQFVGPVTTEEA